MDMDIVMDLDKIKELIETKQYSLLREMLSEMNEADIAAMMEELTGDDMLTVFRFLPKDMAADVFSYLPIEYQQDIITDLSDKEAANVIDSLMADDAADLMEEMPANVVKKLLANASPETRRDINLLLRYPEDSAGSIMTVEFVDLKETLTVEQAILRIRRTGVDKETIDVCYVLDNRRKLIGSVTLRRLLLSSSDELIENIMNEHVISVHTLMDQEEVSRQFQKYDFTSMPVVDNENRLVGIITVDDIVDILQEETTEDIEKMAAIVPNDKPYMRTGIIDTWKKRIPWLLFLMVSATFTGAIISSFEDALSSYVVLTAFIPMLMDTGGYAGGQASATIIRGLSLEEIEFGDILRVMWKEMRVGVFCGVTLAGANFIKMLVFDRTGVPVACVVCLTLIVAVTVAKLIGCSLPMIARRIGFDPAVMASPFITTIVDALSLLVYFRFATLILHIG